MGGLLILISVVTGTVALAGHLTSTHTARHRPLPR